MPSLQELEQRILANGRVDGPDLRLLQDTLHANGKISRKEADFLVELYKRSGYHTAAFLHFFYQSIKSHILADGRIGAEETAWLKRMLLRDGRLADEERKFLHELKGEAREKSPEFEELFNECMKLPMEQRTSGRQQ